MTDKTLFERIIDREIPADIVYEDEQCIAFRDVNPQAPMHILVCPKKPLAMVSVAGAEDASLLGQLMLRAAQIADEQGYKDAFRLVINNGAAVGQTVFHIHVHLLGGRSFTWPPG
jgi:histidine triad (HIT) family protein